MLYILILFLLNKNTLGEDSNSFDDDDYIDNANIHINIFNTYDDCIDNNNSIYKAKTSFEFECECISDIKCLNNLLNSSKFNKLYFKYNNLTIYLNKLNYTNQCQKYENYYIYHDIEIYNFCSTLIIFYVFIILLVLVSIICFINYKYKNTLVVKINNNNNTPPRYESIN